MSATYINNTLLRLLWIIILIITRIKSQISCKEGVDCIIDCSNANYTCRGNSPNNRNIINATQATGLTLLCYGSSLNSICRYLTIYTPKSTQSITNIECGDGSNACFTMDIYYLEDATSTIPLTHSINLFCISSFSCSGVNINAPRAGQFTLECKDGARCNTVDAYVENAGIVNITCIGSNSYGGCRNPTIDARNANSLYVYAKYWGISEGKIYGQNISNIFEIIAIGTEQYYGIKETTIYIPDSNDGLSNFYFECYGSGCYHDDGVNFEKINNYSNIDYANIYYNGCIDCSEAKDCIGPIYTDCDEGTGDFFPNNDELNCGPENSTKCSCNTFAEIFENSFINDPSDENCIFPSNFIECDIGLKCEIDCNLTNCVNNTIIGSRASSLIIDCNGINSCKDTIIYPTTYLLSNTEIICRGGINITNTACNGNFTIMGSDSFFINITSEPFGLNGGNIFIENILNLFILKCIGNGINNGACIGNTNIYLPYNDNKLSNIKLNCIGTGCQEINFIKNTGFSNIEKASIEFDECSQCDNQFNKCVNKIGILCNNSTENNNYFPSSIDNIGCISDNNCQCNTFSTFMTDSFNYDCLTDTPTSIPTQTPSTSQGGASSKDGDNNNLGVIIGVSVGSVVILILIIIGCIYLYKKNEAYKNSIENNTANF